MLQQIDTVLCDDDDVVVAICELDATSTDMGRRAVIHVPQSLLTSLKVSVTSTKMYLIQTH